ncbi:hypothetical protein FKE98_11255 [Corynebacterium aurimucosum]|uniref:hypothetical protein n=1 Tax=Corynebacterium TaxID=1716 RepID=UPI00114D351C|nr:MULTISPECIES: hypothetical protein [Corynebacterium]MDK6807231.1 hypothetical protein [Corynebacterium aurimucosum]MTE10934.1 hypothetical protein [Corynebacterium guaraldiae]NJJ83516.1 hypothetical protein [Corynebacterium aurimucosum]TRX31288.1 hypothetical protein FNY86_12055 [Corynebacterium guaraldiae]HCT9180503.1 hypothetical protein [Corynebacterium aurimucosum]
MLLAPRLERIGLLESFISVPWRESKEYAMRFSQTSATFSHSYNAAFLKDLKSVRFSTQNGAPSSSRFLETFLSKGLIPQVRDGLGGLLFLVIMVVASACIFLFALLLNGFDISWLLAFFLGALLCCHLCVVARQWVLCINRLVDRYSIRTKRCAFPGKLVVELATMSI